MKLYQRWNVRLLLARIYVLTSGKKKYNFSTEKNWLIKSHSVLIHGIWNTIGM